MPSGGARRRSRPSQRDRGPRGRAGSTRRRRSARRSAGGTCRRRGRRSASGTGRRIVVPSPADPLPAMRSASRSAMSSRRSRPCRTQAPLYPPRSDRPFHRSSFDVTTLGAARPTDEPTSRGRFARAGSRRSPRRRPLPAPRSRRTRVAGLRRVSRCDLDRVTSTLMNCAWIARTGGWGFMSKWYPSTIRSGLYRGSGSGR